MSALNPRDWRGAVERRLDDIRSASRWRTAVAIDSFGPVGAVPSQQREVVAFASNDYLGLTAHPAVMEAATAAIRRWGTGSGASRLVVGSRPVHDELEAELAAWKHAERAVVFPTGYAANLGVLTALARIAPGEGRPLFLSDEVNHASIIDGCRLAAADVAVYPHRDVAEVRRLLADAAAAGRAAVVVTDTVFSMDGDIAPVAELLDACRSTGAVLVVDEAHAVFGPELPPVPPAGAGDDAVVLRVGTLSKTLASLGGFVAGPAPFVDLLVNTARPYIFTTATPPSAAAAALAALRVVRSPEGHALVAHLRHLVDRVLPGHPSPIVPLVLGADERALAAAAALAERGLLVPAIRPPTVAVGTARLRVALSAAHTDEQLDRLLGALHDLGIDPTGSTAAGVGAGPSAGADLPANGTAHREGTA